MSRESAKVVTGLDVLIGERCAPLKGRRVGAICNPTSVDSRMHHLADLLHLADGVDLVTLFGPEHGIRADAQDMIGVASDVDSRTGVPVHSLYGSNVESLTPTAAQLDGLDLLVFDVQDVGSRYYTFAATMLYAMKASAAKGIAFLVLDRPNPIGGARVEGPTLRPGFESFVGPHPMPIRHAMTVGELARLFRAELRLDLDLEIVPCQGWSREMLWRHTGLAWVLPSPNMPTPETALVYPGGCLIEGTNLSEGRGTTRPFELWGAPWLAAWMKEWPVDSTNDPAVLCRPCAFRPMFHKHARQLCYGVQPHVTDPGQFAPVVFYTEMIQRVRTFSPERFAWRTEPYEFVSEPIAIDLLYGSARERQAMESGLPWSDWSGILNEWATESSEFEERRDPFLLYE